MNNNPTTATVRAGDSSTYRPRLAFYHPNMKGTGCAMQMELHPAHDRHDGSIMMSIANQLSVANRNGSAQTFARFDWERKITVKLDFADLSKMLQVFRGECESIDDGRGLYHRAPNFSTRIVFRHIIEPVQGYSLELYRTSSNGGEEARAHIVLNSWEALGLMESIAGSMAVISFGIPMLVEHDTSAYEAEVKGMRNGGVA